MSKSAEAFRTISEVADELEVPKHVLRFWEQRFPQIKPMKRGGGRRYYRPEDLELLRGIRRLLHAEGYTIKGVQKILREQGVDSVKAAGSVPSGAPISDAPHVLAKSKKALSTSKRPARAAAHTLDGEAGPAGQSRAPARKRTARGKSKSSAVSADSRGGKSPSHAQCVSSAIAELEDIRKLLMAVAPVAKAARTAKAKRPAAKRRARSGSSRA